MTEFISIVGTGGDYCFAHYTQIRIIKNKDGYVAWVANNTHIGLSEEEAEKCIEKLNKISSEKEGVVK